MKIKYSELTHFIGKDGNIKTNCTITDEFSTRARSEAGLSRAVREYAEKSYRLWSGFYEKYPFACDMDGRPEEKIYEFACSYEIDGFRRAAYHLYVPFDDWEGAHEVTYRDGDDWGAYRLQRSYPRAELEGRIKAMEAA